MPATHNSVRQQKQQQASHTNFTGNVLWAKGITQGGYCARSIKQRSCTLQLRLSSPAGDVSTTERTVLKVGYAVSAVLAAAAELDTVIQQRFAYDTVELCHSGAVCSCEAHGTLCMRPILSSICVCCVTLLLAVAHRTLCSCRGGFLNCLRGCIAKRTSVQGSDCHWRVLRFSRQGC